MDLLLTWQGQVRSSLTLIAPLISLIVVLTLPPGVYSQTFTVYDTHDNSLVGSLTITIGNPVLDEISPVWVVSPYDITIEEGVPFYLQVGAWDESGIDDWEISGSSAFTIDSNGVITNSSVLQAGTYNLEVRGYDPAGNYCSATFIVTVVEADDTTAPPIGTDYGFFIGIGGIGIALVALFLGLGAFLNTRRTPELG